MSLNGISQDMLLEKILLAIDNGHTTEEIRKDPLKCIVSGKTKKIVYCTIILDAMLMAI